MNNKFQKIRDLTHKPSPSILCLQETRGRNPLTDYSIRGYHAPYIRTRTGEGMNLGGGIGIWVQSNLDYNIINSPYMDKVIECQTIEIPKQRIAIINIYCPFLDTEKCLEKLDNHLNGVIKKLTYHDIIMTGDFNIDLLKMNSEAQKLQNITISHGMLQQVKKPTRVHNNKETLIGHVYTRSKVKLKTDVIISDISDHYERLTTYLDKKRDQLKLKATVK